MLEGSIDFRVGEQAIRAEPGDVVHVPRGCEHSFSCAARRLRRWRPTAPRGDEELLRAASVLIEDRYHARNA